ncbi:hypothetical protein [Roseateles flavus]|uniref:Lipocalin-like domain-containing protein n=1 Tax=Roseateles flavus TaxID=3149041 RepID=A0ABV0G8G9_9BURK
MNLPHPMSLTFANERDASDIETQPRVLVHSWRLIRTRTGTLHLVTFRDVGDEQETVCVTSAISAVERGRVAVTTSSGRMYELAGPAEEREIEREMLRAGAVRLGMGGAVDVSVLAWDLVGLD